MTDIPPDIMERAKVELSKWWRKVPNSHLVSVLREEWVKRELSSLLAAALQAERNRALEDAAQWHEEAKTPERGAEYGLMNEYERREVRKSNEAHSFAAVAIRALAAPKQETDHDRG